MASLSSLQFKEMYLLFPFEKSKFYTIKCLLVTVFIILLSGRLFRVDLHQHQL